MTDQQIGRTLSWVLFAMAALLLVVVVLQLLGFADPFFTFIRVR